MHKKDSCRQQAIAASPWRACGGEFQQGSTLARELGAWFGALVWVLSVFLLGGGTALAQQVGINIDKPENTLDVNGTMRVRHLPKVPPGQDIYQVQADARTGDFSVLPFRRPESVKEVRMFHEIRIPVKGAYVGSILEDDDPATEGYNLSALLAKAPYNVTTSPRDYVVMLNSMQLVEKNNPQDKSRYSHTLLAAARARSAADGTWDRRIGNLVISNNELSVVDHKFQNPHYPVATLNEPPVGANYRSMEYSPIFYTLPMGFVSFRNKPDGTGYWSLYLDMGDSGSIGKGQKEWHISLVLLSVPWASEVHGQEYRVTNPGRPNSTSPSQISLIRQL